MVNIIPNTRLLWFAHCILRNVFRILFYAIQFLKFLKNWWIWWNNWKLFRFFVQSWWINFRLLILLVESKLQFIIRCLPVFLLVGPEPAELLLILGFFIFVTICKRICVAIVYLLLVELLFRLLRVKFKSAMIHKLAISRIIHVPRAGEWLIQLHYFFFFTLCIVLLNGL